MAQVCDLKPFKILDEKGQDLTAQISKPKKYFPLNIELKNGKTKLLSVELAKTEKERSAGLMCRTTMAENEGMLFIFDQPQTLSFWMKNTLIPLDMIFLNAEYKIINIQKNVQPCKADPCPLYSSEKAAKYVLEINGGMSDTLGIEVGTALVAIPKVL